MKTKIIPRLSLSFVCVWCFWASIAVAAGAVHKIELEEKIWSVPQSMSVLVLDEQKQPVPGATLNLRFYPGSFPTGTSNMFDEKTQTDASGAFSSRLRRKTAAARN